MLNTRQIDNVCRKTKNIKKSRERARLTKWQFCGRIIIMNEHTNTPTHQHTNTPTHQQDNMAVWQNDPSGHIDFVGEKLPIFTLDHEVFSCEQAALAKGIPLDLELKHLALYSEKIGKMLLHMPADLSANWRALKNYLDTKRIEYVTQDVLRQLGHDYGTVNPFGELGELPQFIAIETLSKPYVSTNAGQTNKFTMFDPKLLLKMNNRTVGEFAKEREY